MNSTKYYNDRLTIAKEIIEELQELGPDYRYFMNAQSTHKKLTKIKNLIETI